ncbi:AAA family ATPase [Allostreptomyces psammosilenae]|uniref:Energy-coupling factor transporter ATP-binding protein EcfA2 n=1 Tax=Allostreptomyces psammosilenae TaxID=1892865 RepID=A0A853AB05_9ACTN|nr:AAA family ATPase [Allostreptomyces psammosilenae]NYI07801.1 energy-coupling factor transporter ATP-binding protein EcfA2 [Allostreptomyces psammosilenae]
MYVSRLRIREIRGFHGDRNVDLTLTRPDGTHAGWTVLAGRNGSGKTTLLKSLALALAGPDTAAALEPALWKWRTEEKTRGTVEVDVLLDQQEARRYFSPGKSPDHSIHASVGFSLPSLEKVPNSRKRRGQQFVITWKNKKHLTPAQKEDWEGPAGDSLWQDKPDNWFCAGYGPFRRLSNGTLGSQRIAEEGTADTVQLITLFHEGASLAESVNWLISQHLRRLEERPGAKELLDTVFALLSDGLLPDGYRVNDVNSEGLWVTRDDRKFALSEMSDGFRTVTAVIVDLVRNMERTYGKLELKVRNGVPTIDLPGVVLVDEIDAHLHMSWQQRIGVWLKTHFPLVQFIVTTHSPYICQAADPGGLIRLPGPGEDAPPRIVDEDLYHRVVYGSGDDAALSELFGLDSPYSPTAEALRREVGELEGRVLTGEATAEEIVHYQQLSRILSSSMSARVDEVSARLRRPH